MLDALSDAHGFWRAAKSSALECNDAGSSDCGEGLVARLWESKAELRSALQDASRASGVQTVVRLCRFIQRLLQDHPQSERASGLKWTDMDSMAQLMFRPVLASAVSAQDQQVQEGSEPVPILHFVGGAS